MTRLPAFLHFQQGRSGRLRRLGNVMQGTYRDGRMYVFDYKYSLYRGSRRGGSHVPQMQTVVCFELPEAQWPAFSLRAKPLWRNVPQELGYREMEFPDRPTITGRYRLQGVDEAGVRALFTPPVLSFYESEVQESSLGIYRLAGTPCTEAGGRWLLFCRHATLVEPKEIGAFLDEGYGVLALFRRP